MKLKKAVSVKPNIEAEEILINYYIEMSALGRKMQGKPQTTIRSRIDSTTKKYAIMVEKQLGKLATITLTHKTKKK